MKKYIRREKIKDLLVAQQIFVIGTSTATSTASGEPAVKSAITQTPNNQATTATSSALSPVGVKKTTQNSTSTQLQGNPNTVTGSFIIETPEPQVAN